MDVFIVCGGSFSVDVVFVAVAFVVDEREVEIAGVLLDVITAEADIDWVVFLSVFFPSHPQKVMSTQLPRFFTPILRVQSCKKSVKNWI